MSRKVKEDVGSLRDDDVTVFEDRGSEREWVLICERHVGKTRRARRRACELRN